MKSSNTNVYSNAGMVTPGEGDVSPRSDFILDEVEAFLSNFMVSWPEVNLKPSVELRDDPPRRRETHYTPPVQLEPLHWLTSVRENPRELRHLGSGKIRRHLRHEMLVGDGEAIRVGSNMRTHKKIVEMADAGCQCDGPQLDSLMSQPATEIRSIETFYVDDEEAQENKPNDLVIETTHHCTQIDDDLYHGKFDMCAKIDRTGECFKEYLFNHKITHFFATSAGRDTALHIRQLNGDFCILDYGPWLSTPGMWTMIRFGKELAPKYPDFVLSKYVQQQVDAINLGWDQPELVNLQMMSLAGVCGGVAVGAAGTYAASCYSRRVCDNIFRNVAESAVGNFENVLFERIRASSALFDAYVQPQVFKAAIASAVGIHLGKTLGNDGSNVFIEFISHLTSNAHPVASVLVDLVLMAYQNISGVKDKERVMERVVQQAGGLHQTSLRDTLTTCNAFFTLMKNVEQYTKKILSSFFPELYITYIMQTDEEMKDFVRQVDAVSPDVKITKKKLDEYARLIEIWEEKLPKSVQNANIHVMRMFREKIEEMRRAITQVGERRVKPFVVYLFGDSQIGKTVYSRRLGKTIAKEVYDDEEALIYSRGKTDHWDGYRGQGVVLYDDLFCTLDDERINSFLNICSEDSVILPMAALADKGTVFNSPVIICTSNVPRPTPEKYVCADAVWNRFDVYAKMYLNEKGDTYFKVSRPEYEHGVHVPQYKFAAYCVALAKQLKKEQEDLDRNFTELNCDVEFDAPIQKLLQPRFYRSHAIRKHDERVFKAKKKDPKAELEDEPDIVIDKDVTGQSGKWIRPKEPLNVPLLHKDDEDFFANYFKNCRCALCVKRREEEKKERERREKLRVNPQAGSKDGSDEEDGSSSEDDEDHPSDSDYEDQRDKHPIYRNLEDERRFYEENPEYVENPDAFGARRRAQMKEQFEKRKIHPLELDPEEHPRGPHPDFWHLELREADSDEEQEEEPGRIAQLRRRAHRVKKHVRDKSLECIGRVKAMKAQTYECLGHVRERARDLGADYVQRAADVAFDVRDAARGKYEDMREKIDEFEMPEWCKTIMKVLQDIRKSIALASKFIFDIAVKIGKCVYTGTKTLFGQAWDRVKRIRQGPIANAIEDMAMQNIYAITGFASILFVVVSGLMLKKIYSQKQEKVVNQADYERLYTRNAAKKLARVKNVHQQNTSYKTSQLVKDPVYKDKDCYQAFFLGTADNWSGVASTHAVKITRKNGEIEVKEDGEYGFERNLKHYLEGLNIPEGTHLVLCRWKQKGVRSHERRWNSYYRAIRQVVSEKTLAQERSYLTRNVVRVIYHSRIVHGIAVGNIVFTVAHIFGCEHERPEHDTVKIITVQGTYTVDIAGRKLFSDGDFVAIPVIGMNARNIAGRFADRPLQNTGIVSDFYTEFWKEDLYYAAARKGAVPAIVNFDVECDVCREREVLVLKTEGTNFNGLCGAPYVLSLSGKICGMHIAGKDENAYFKTITKGEVLNMQKHFARINALITPQYGFIADHERLLCVPPNFEFVRFGDATVHVPRKSKITPTSYFGVFGEVTTAPPVLEKEDPRYRGEESIMAVGLAKMYKDIHQYPLHLMNEIIEHMSCKFSRKSLNDFVTTGRITKEMNINGHPDVEGAEKMNFSSSDGEYYTSTRTPLFYEREMRHYFTDFGLQEYRRVKRDMKSGEYFDFIYTAYLKDEPRPLEKMRAGKTRLFMGCNKIAVMLCRKYMLDFVAFLHRTTDRSSIAVGVNPLGYGWTALANRLQEKGDYGFAADFSQFDGSLYPIYFLMLAEIINNWYAQQGEEAEGVYRTRLIAEYCLSQVAVGSHLYRKTHGLPSGCFGTAEFNSLINQMIFYFAFKEISPEMSLQEIDDRVASSFFGDDNIHIVRQDSPQFNLARVALVLEKYGIEITTESKEKPDVTMAYDDYETLVSRGALRNLQQMSFLKRTFVADGGFYKAPIEIGSLHNSLMWSNKGMSYVAGEKYEHVIGKMALAEAMHHGEQVYTETRDALLSREDFEPPTYQELEQKWTEDCRKGLAKIQVSTQDIKYAPTMVHQQMLKMSKTNQINTQNSSAVLDVEEPVVANTSTDTENRSQTVHLTNTTPVVQADKGDAVQSAEPLMAMSYNDPTRSLGEQMAKDSLVASFDWDATTLPGSPLAILEFPRAFAAANPQNAFLKNFTYLNGDLEFTIVVNGTPFYQGKLIAAWTPVTKIPMNLQRLTTLNHVEIDAAQNINVKLQAQYSHVFNMLKLYDNPGSYKEVFGYLYIYVFNTLQTLATPVSLAVNVYARVINANIRNPTYEHNFDTIREKAEKAQLQSGFEKLFDTGMKILPEVLEVISDLDHPNVSAVHQKEETNSDVTHGDGGTTSTRLNMSQKWRTPMPADFADTRSFEMMLPHLVRKWGFFTTYNWSQTLTTGDVLFDMPVHPTHFIDGAWPTGAASNLCYLSAPYVYWRGSIELQIDIIATQFHRGRLHIAFLPDVFTATSLSSAKSNPSYVIDIQDKRSFVISIPWVSQQLYKEVQNPSDTGPAAGKNKTGTLFCYVLNPLTSSATVAGNVDINIKVRGGRDFELAYPRDIYDLNFVGDYTVPTVSLKGMRQIDRDTVRLQSGDCACDCIYCRPTTDTGTGQEATLDSEDKTPAKFVDLVGPGQLGGQTHMNLRKLLRRPGLRYDYSAPLADASTWNRMARITNGFQPRGRVPVRCVSMHDYFSFAYMFMRGPLRYHFINNYGRGINAIYKVRSREAIDFLDDINPVIFPLLGYDYFSKMGSLAIEPAVEVTSNYMNLNQKMLTHVYEKEDDFFEFTTGGETEYFIKVDQSFAGPWEMVILHSFSDETIFSYYLGPPPTVEEPTP